MFSNLVVDMGMLIEMAGLGKTVAIASLGTACWVQTESAGAGEGDVCDFMAFE